MLDWIGSFVFVAKGGVAWFILSMAVIGTGISLVGIYDWLRGCFR